MGNENTSRIVQAPGMETNQGELARPPIVRFNIGAKTRDSLAKTENLAVPLWILLPKSWVQWVLKFCHRSRQRSSDPAKCRKQT